MNTDIKNKIRADLLKKRRGLPATFRKAASQQITERILDLPIFQSSTTVALYHAFAGEVDLENLWAIACQLGKKTGFPVISKANNQMVFFESTPEMPEHVNRFNIREPANCPEKLISTFDLMIIPLVAFDKQGYRLGMGGGYYDRFLNRQSCIKIGVGYDFQCINELPHDPWDVSLDMMITEKTVYP